MSCGDLEPYYAISFIHYAHPERRAGFRRFAEVLARSMATPRVSPVAWSFWARMKLP